MRKLIWFSAWIVGLTTLLSSAVTYAQCNATGVGGTVFRDFNFNGVQDAASASLLAETGYAGVTVTVYGSNGTSLGTATTNATGAWTVSGLTASTRVLVKYSPPAGWFPGAIGSNSNSELQLVTVGSCALKSGVATPPDYCQATPNLIGSCLSDRYQIVKPNTFVTNAWDITDNATLYIKKFGETGLGMTALTKYNQTGNLFGVAYARKTKMVFGSSYIRSGGINASALGKIFRYDAQKNAVTTWADLPALGYSVGNPVDVNVDQNAQFVGYTNLGDVDISRDESQLYVANIFSKKILILPVATDGSLNSAGIKQVTLPTPCGSAANTAVCGLGVHANGRVYAGVTCTGPLLKDIKLTVYSFDPAAGDPTSTVQLELTLDNLMEKVAPWKNYGPTDWPKTETVALQLWLTDIEFRYNNDGSENMYLGTRNRGLDQSIATPGSCSFSSPVPIYMAQRATSAASWAKANVSFPSEYGTSGSLAYQGGYQSIVAMYRDCNSNAQDPNSFGGFRLYPIAGGTKTAEFKALQTAFSEVLMRFNNIWADAEFMCDAAPISIGNLVWYDKDSDGIRDIDEASVSAITVSLFKDSNNDGQFDANDEFVSSTQTNTEGHYYFTNLLPNTKYVVALNSASNFAIGGKLEGATLSPANAGTSDCLDSDASTQNNFPAIAFTTGDAGQNNYTYDFGVVITSPPGLAPIGCYSISSILPTTQEACIGQPALPVAVISDAANGTVLKFVAFPTQQTGTAMYTGGTLMTTATVTDGVAYFTPTVPGTAGSQFIYAIPNVTPAAANCRPFAETVLITKDCDAIPDLSLKKSVTPIATQVGQPVTYKLVIKNSGTAGATGVTVDDAIPAGLSITGSSATVGTYAANTWTVGALAVGDSATLTLNATVTQTGIFYNTAEIKTSTTPDKDSNPNNKKVTEDDIARACVATPIEICPGESYTISIPDSYTGVQWFKNNSAIAGATKNAYLASEEGVYTVTATAENGASATGGCGFELKFKAGIVEPTLTSADTDLCVEESTTLVAANGATYLWSTGETTASIVVSPPVTTTYTVTTTTATCARSFDKSITVVVNPKPTAFTFGPTQACTSKPITLTAIGGDSYSWSSGGTTSITTVTTPGTAGTQNYDVTVTNSYGCTTLKTMTVDVVANCGPCPTVTIVEPGQTCCYGNLPTAITITVAGATVDSVDVSIFYEKNNSLTTLYDDILLYSVARLPIVGGQAIWTPSNQADLFKGELADTRTIYVYAGLAGKPADTSCRPYDFHEIQVNRKPYCPKITDVKVD